MEKREIYDENRRPTGRYLTPGEKLAPGEYLVAVGVWVFNEKNQVLLTRRALTKRFAPGLWENTGGHLTMGEDSRSATVRELFEETGIRVEPEQLVLLGQIKEAPYFGDDYAVRLDFTPAEIRLQPGETDAAKWVSREEFEAMIVSGELAPSVVSHLAPHRDAFDRMWKTEK